MNHWKLYDCANGKKNCENCKKTSDDIFDVLNVLKREFSIEYDEKATAGLDGVYFAVTINQEEVTVGWDVWSGVFIMAKNENGNAIVENIYRFLSK